jgi:hypothetical protein
MGIPIRGERHTSPIPTDSVIIPSVPGDLTVENQDEISSDRVGSPELEEGESWNSNILLNQEHYLFRMHPFREIVTRAMPEAHNILSIIYIYCF